MTTRPIFDVINISMSRLTTTVTRQGFGAALHLFNFDTTLNRVTTISKASYAATLLALGITSTDAAYLALQDHFAQEPSPNTAYLGRVQSTRQDFAIVWDVGTSYYIDVVTSTGTTPYGPIVGLASAAATATALAALVTAHASVTAAGVGDDVQVTLVAGQEVYCAGRATGAAGTIDAIPTAGTVEDFDDALVACVGVSSDWYGIIGTGTQGRTLAQQKLVADWAETNDRLYIVASADVNIVDLDAAADVSTSIAGYCKAQALKNTSVIYHTSAATEYLDAGWMGKCLPKDPGSINWNFQTISSITVDNTITPTNRTYMGEKGCSWYEVLAGTNATQLAKGKAQNGYGDFIDVTRISHWAKYRVVENLLALVLAQDKVAYDDTGLASMGAEIREVMQTGEENGAFTDGWTVTVPTAASISASVKATRNAPSLEFRAPITGSINSADVAGYITL